MELYAGQTVARLRVAGPTEDFDAQSERLYDKIQADRAQGGSPPGGEDEGVYSWTARGKGDVALARVRDAHGGEFGFPALVDFVHSNVPYDPSARRAFWQRLRREVDSRFKE